MRQLAIPYLFLAFSVLCRANPSAAQKSAPDSPVLQRCVRYSGTGDLLEAQVTHTSIKLLIVRLNGNRVELAGDAAAVSDSAATSRTKSCQLVISDSSDQAALALVTDKGLDIELINLKSGSFRADVFVPNEFPIEFPIHPIGYAAGSDLLQVSQVHYLATGEPQILTKLISPDGTATASHETLGAQYTEVYAPSFDFSNSLVWFFCPVYATRWDRQPPCTLKSGSLNSFASATPTIPPRPGTGDARVSGNNPLSLGFPSSNTVVVLGYDNLWVYDLGTAVFRHMKLPETPQHFRWTESPGQPKFTSDAHFAVVPVYLSHAPLFEEGQISHGTKLLIIDIVKLEILCTIQPPDHQNVTDFALRDEGKSLKLVASWSGDWKTFDIPVSSMHP